MDSRNGLLTLAVYLTATMLLALVALLGVYKYSVDNRIAAWQPIAVEAAPELAVAHVDLSANTSGQRARTANVERQRIRLLEAMLQDKTQRLRQLSELLTQKTSELEELRARYDEAVVLAVETLTRDSGAARETPPAADQEPAGRKTDPALLEAELSVAHEVHESLVSDVTALQEELSGAQRELDQLKVAQDQEMIERLREATVLEDAAASILQRVGPEAVPALRDALNHPSPAVRRWAATVLGDMGADAEDALAALAEALSDTDPSVRRAVQLALEAIER